MTNTWMVGVLIAAIGWPFGGTFGMAQQRVTNAQAELAKALPSARVSLEDGLAASRREGTPISARFEVEEGTFQLSVFVVKGGRFSEVIVDHRSGKITTVAPLKEREDLTAAKAQLVAMNRARKSLQAALDATVKAHAGYRAVSIIPALKGGQAVAEVTLARGNQFKKVSVRLD